MTKTLRKGAAGLIVAGVWGWVPWPAVAQDMSTRTMRVLILNPAGAAPTVLADAEAAAARVFRHAGIETTWRHASDGRGDPYEAPPEDLTSVIVINLMSPQTEARVRESARAVGFAVAGDRFANIMYRRVERLARETSADLATLLGHVIAHEIGHLLLPPDAHSSGGIMNATLDPLLADQAVLWFSPTEAADLRTRNAALEQTHDAIVHSQLVRDRIE